MIKITNEELQKKILLYFYDMGLELFQKNSVLKCNLVNSGQNFIQLNSTVVDDDLYIQDILITKENNNLKLDGKCSCEIAHNCNHVAAACIYYIEKLQKNSMSDIDKWLNSFEVDDNSNELSEEFLIYRLYGKSLCVYQAKWLKKVKVPSKGRMLNISNFYSDVTDNKDEEILSMIRGLKGEYSYSDCLRNFKGKLGNTLFKTLIEYKKLFMGDGKEPVTLKKTNDINLRFSKKEDYSSTKYAIKVSGTKKLILSNPPFFINEKENCLEEIEIDGNKLDMILSFPTFEFKEIPKVANTILKYLDVEIKPPKEMESKTIETQLIPRILLFNNSFKLDFKYDDYFVSFYPQREKKEFFEKNGKITLIRDLEKEKEYKNFIENSFKFNFNNFNNELFVNLEKDTENLENWKNFLNSLEKLKNDGWIIEKNDNFELTFDEESKIVIESKEDEDNWFSLSFEFEFNGKILPLAPLVSSILNEVEDLEKLPEKLFLEVEENYFVEVESKELKPIIKTLMLLLHKKASGEEYKLTLADAALLDEIDDLEIEGSKKLFEIAKKLKNFEGIETVNIPKNLNAELRDYQKEGLNWLNFLWEYSFNGILADDMGLGKTIQTLAHLLRLKENGKLTTSLIVVPTSLLANWKNEIEQFTPDLSKIIYYGNDRKNIFDDLKNYDIIITTYSILTRDILKLKHIEFDYIILDEAQKIKNPRAKVTMGVKLLKAKHKLALSGTPIENNLGELWSIFSFLMPGFLGNNKFFKDYFQKPIENENDFSKKELLYKKTKAFILRRTKEKVITELPAKTEIIKYTQFSTKQAKLYETIRITMEEKVREAIEKRGLNGSHFTILDALLKLRQVCCDPRLLKVEKKLNESAKLELFLEIVEELLAEKRKILVFSQFTSMLEIIEQELQKREIEFVKLTGSTRKREEVINKFKKEDIPIFLISLKAGGVGLNLTEADTIIHYDPWWNPAVENQATDRAYRIGQDKPVFVYKLIVENTIEQKIIELQKKKANIQKIISDDTKTKFDKNELLELLK